MKEKTNPASQDIINDDHLLSLHRSTDKGTSLPMILLLLPVVAVLPSHTVLLLQSQAGDGGERDALVGRSEEEVKVGRDGGGHDGGRIGLGDGGQDGSVVEKSGIEEVRGNSKGAYRFQRGESKEE